MDITTDLINVLNEAMTYSSASMVYTSGSTDVSCSVYVQYGEQQQYQTDEDGYQKVYLDFSVMALWSDVSSWGLTPKVSKVTLDGTPYLVGGVITYTTPYAWITLRDYDSSV